MYYICCLREERKISPKKHIKYINFRSKVQLVHPVLLLSPPLFTLPVAAEKDLVLGHRRVLAACSWPSAARPPSSSSPARPPPNGAPPLRDPGEKRGLHCGKKINFSPLLSTAQNGGVTTKSEI